MTPKKCSNCGAYIRVRKERELCYICTQKFLTVKTTNGMVSTGTVGAMSELSVASLFMGKGYDVFRALSPASPFDIVIHKDNKLTRIEVTTGTEKNGEKCRSYIHKAPQKDRFDYLAVVFPSGINFFVYDICNDTFVEIPLEAVQ